jgi:hypothetical protein
MTRKHFDALAWRLRETHPKPTHGQSFDSDYYAGLERQWDMMVIAIAEFCLFANPRFNRDRFLRAAGYTLRPDGSPYPAKWFGERLTVG